MSDIIENTIRRVSATHQIPDATLRAVLAEFMAAVHEAEFKGKYEPGALNQIYFSLGPEAASHFFGCAMQILDYEESRYVSDLQSLWTESAIRLDGSMQRFRFILQRWEKEREFAGEDQVEDESDEQ